MKLAAFIIGSLYAQEAYDYSNDDSIARTDYADEYYFYEYIDELGNKKKKKKNKKNKNNNYNNNNYNNDNYNNDNYAADPYNYNTGWNTGYAASYGKANAGEGKGVNSDPTIGNGRFCFNCKATIKKNYDGSGNFLGYIDPYVACFDSTNDQYGYIEKCIGEEYYCDWEERRHKGVVVAVSGGCKAPEACLRLMIQNFNWKVAVYEDPQLRGDQCKSGTFGYNRYEDSVCRWCCDALTDTLDRYNPLATALCNHEEFAGSPAHDYKNNGQGDTFEWATPTNLFNGLNTDGKYHSLFMVHRQYALGEGETDLSETDMVRGTMP